VPGKAAAQREVRPGRLTALGAVLEGCGWAEVGGRIIRDASDRVCGRTPWIPRHPWWLERPEGLTERRAHQVVALALEGRTLGDRQRAYLAWLVAQADELARGEGEGSVSSDNACDSYGTWSDAGPR
jgi:hypothetical protein